MSIYTASEIKAWDIEGKMSRDEPYRPARSLNYQCDRWRDRIRWAWGVLTGKYDALKWEVEKEE